MSTPKQERAVQTRESILRAAAEVFDEFGFAGASINRILTRAGVTSGAMYHHFESKEALARTLMNAQPGTIVPWLESTGLQHLIDLTLLWSHQLRVDPILRAGVRLTGEQATFGIQDSSPYRNWTEIMADCLAVAAEKGELRPGVEAHAVAEFVVESCTGMQMVATVVSGREDLADRVARMWHLLLPGIAVPAAIMQTQVSADRLKQLLSTQN
ncbi:ScbR family autoregulator-binding transcription factor [Streptomyces sp. CB01580]|uniref:ScbR family autoregulator-binding transcription factor n=1 Tax=Streptomyces sp. CB01580 TaxID=1703933 RepID=UPI00093C7B66|nr:ScbR family autoregulator-binding transcription factor [Streptomyces sp. CB01580]OKJ32534.1 branched-chain amino acid aminotransferase [Streptomyces sp. CB01580]